MKYLTNKKFLGGVAVLTVLVGLYFGLTSISSTDKPTEATTTSQTEAPVTGASTAPAVNTEAAEHKNTSAPAVNTVESQVNSIKNSDDSTETAK